MKKQAFAIALFIFAIFISLHSSGKNIAVFCSADDKVNTQFKTLAYNLGQLLSQNNLGLVTGGSRTGLMKEVIDGYISKAQNLEQLFGVLPQALASYNVHHQSIPQANLKWSATMHTRLSDFHNLSDTIIILPGGYGTLHELMDFIVHNQFGIHKTNIVVINAHGFWNSLIAQFKTMLQEQLISLKQFESLIIVQSITECIEKVIKPINNSSGEQGLSTHYWEQR